MKIINNISEMQKWQNDSAKIAFVPTMGGLHQGHLSLIELAKKKPIGGGQYFCQSNTIRTKRDFATYPRTIERIWYYRIHQKTWLRQIRKTCILMR
ncbi:hypothetical protein BSPWISOXPB_10560 [uncultured Gammaproteobacteria bacterium]|nr:hypothetical protein BSPWISOXPB_10560 [uncultured Gammaproteobacteria bacterium]